MGWNIKMPDAEYFTLQHPGLDGLVREITDQKAVAIDTETDGLVLHKCRPYYWSICWTNERGRERRITLPADTLGAFKYAFNDYEKKWVFANAKFDMHMLANLDIHPKGQLVDVQVMHALLFEEQPHGLKEIARTLLGWKWTDFTDTFGSMRAGICVCGGTKQSHMNQAGICKKTGCSNFQQVGPLDLLRRAEATNMNLLIDYAANDAYGTWKIFKQLDIDLGKEETWSLYAKSWPFITTMRDYYYKTEMPFTRVLYACERNGLRVNKAYLEKISPGILKDMAELRSEINKITGRMMKTNGPQLAEYFIDECGLKPLKLTKGGKDGVKKPSIDEKFLQHVADYYANEPHGEVARLLGEHNKIEKQYSTYIEKMPGRLDYRDRVHPRLNQDVARTGRLSSSDPNLQNVTGGEKDLYKLRNSFIARDGYKLICADYSQLEMRLLAAASQEPAMMEIFHKNWDIHMGNVSIVYGIPYDDMVEAKKIDKLVSKGDLPESAMTDYVKRCLALRGSIKQIGFGLNYGMKEKAMAARIGCTVEEAVATIEKYMDKYPAVRAFFASAAEDARRTGYAFTLMGRRRYLPDITNRDDYTRFRAERQASNMPIQGCLPASTRILTRAGYIPIGEANKEGWVWTGSTWGRYTKLDRGKCELAELHLANGQVLRCDTRHKVLVLEDGEYRFKSYSSLAGGDLVCLSLAQPLDFGPSGRVKDWYWAGFCIGNGSTDKRTGRTTVSIHIGDRKGRYKRDDKTAELEAYLQGKNLSYRVEKSPSGKLMNTVFVTGFQKILRGLGYPLSANGPDKIVPKKLWYLGLACRKAFITGLLDADGSVGVDGSTTPNLHMSSQQLLREVQLILRTTGVESKLRQTGERSWRLDLNGAQAATQLSYGSPRKTEHVPDMPCSKFILDVIASDWNQPKTASHKAIKGRVKEGGQTSVYTANKMIGAPAQHRELYAVYALTGKVALGVEETTYTLSVDNPQHRFDSEGVISKNTAAEVCKMAMINIYEDVELRDKYGYEMCLQVHDEIVGECPEETVDIVLPRIREWMEHPFPSDIGVPLTAEIGAGPSWGTAKK